MRKPIRWIMGAVLGLAAACFAMSGLPFGEATPVYAQAVCSHPDTNVHIDLITPNTMYNTVDTPIMITGSGFGATAGEVVLAGYGPLPTPTAWAVDSITVTVPAGVPGTPAGRAYNVVVFWSDPTICNTRPHGLRVYSPAPTTSPRTATPAPTVFSRPLVTVLSYSASSKVLYPGQNVDFAITLQNTGTATAKNVIVEFSGTDLLPRDTGGLRTPGDIGPGGTVSLSQPLRVSSSLSGYQAVIAIKISYTDDHGANYSNNSTLSFAAGQYAAATPTLSISPQIILSSYQTTPVTLSPGAVFKLDMSLANVSSQIAHQVVVNLGATSSGSTASSAASSTTSSVAPLNSSNMRYIDAMQPGQQFPLSFDMAVSGSAASELANLDVAVSYIDEANNKYSQTETINLRIETKALFLIHFYNTLPDLITVGDTIDLPIEVINIGTNSVNVSIVEATSGQMTITGGSSYFGPLDGGTSGTLAARAQANQAGPATVTVTVNYLDDYQQPQTATQDLTFDIHAVAVTPQSSGGTGQGGNTGGFGGTGGTGGGAGGLTPGQRILRMILGFFGIATQSVSRGGFTPQFSGGAGGGRITPTPSPSGGNAP